MANEARQAVAVRVERPLVLRGIGVASADMPRLEGLELLLRAEFVCLLGVSSDIRGDGQRDMD